MPRDWHLALLFAPFALSAVLLVVAIAIAPDDPRPSGAHDLLGPCPDRAAWRVEQ